MKAIAKLLNSNKDGKLHWFAVTPSIAKRIDRDHLKLEDRLKNGIVYDVIMEITLGTNQLTDGEEIIIIQSK